MVLYILYSQKTPFQVDSGINLPPHTKVSYTFADMLELCSCTCIVY